MKISILLPYKEDFAHDLAGAVSLFVSQISKKSKYRKKYTINLKNIFKNLSIRSNFNFKINIKNFEIKVNSKVAKIFNYCER